MSSLVVTGVRCRDKVSVFVWEIGCTVPVNGMTLVSCGVRSCDELPVFNVILNAEGRTVVERGSL